MDCWLVANTWLTGGEQETIGWPSARGGQLVASGKLPDGGQRAHDVGVLVVDRASGHWVAIASRFIVKRWWKILSDSLLRL